jgi:hypothetical protein
MKRRTTKVAAAGIQTFFLERGETSSQERRDCHQVSFSCPLRISLSIFCYTQGKFSFWVASSTGTFINVLSSSMDLSAFRQARQS